MQSFKNLFRSTENKEIREGIQRYVRTEYRPEDRDFQFKRICKKAGV